MSDIEINSVLTENRLFEPSAEFAAKARIKPEDYEALKKKADEDYEGFWAEQAKQLMDWHTPFTRTLDDSNAPYFKWFTDGSMNVSYNCIDRHLAKHANKTAIIFEGEAGDTRNIR
ncbi:MAG: acetyl-coenzyme A synthetase, partial [Gammaproteobacteria bacterium]|nr:acetyl-coenzyme A synthetase [Gammaproteobacteria bacterium]